ncbi:flavin reductase like domain-containing protein [Lasiosphaeria ovina]|uniref:Flavin reductase like domain-containing protein n=1 Tax=Lasiosphaeria ovina TaxID=92902 RepID=A0AAE0JY04_9PEZI|nr:flavin reductase like domain-containing protein [Lasiosphaeria ovina]
MVLISSWRPWPSQKRRPAALLRPLAALALVVVLHHLQQEALLPPMPPLPLQLPCPLPPGSPPSPSRGRSGRGTRPACPPRPPRRCAATSPTAATADADLDVPPLPPMSEQVRGLMRLLAHSVVACTSTFPGSGTEPTAPRAMTMSSFTSLALSPTPVVSFNISTPSRTFDAVEASRRFNIHVLADDASGARVADWLARGNAGGLHVFEKLAEECQCQVTVQEQEGAGDPPVLHGPGVLYVLRCRLLDQPSQGLIKVRDHVIVLGEVLDILEGERAERPNRGDKFQDSRFGLLYADRTYRQLGSCIIPREEAAPHTH